MSEQGWQAFLAAEGVDDWVVVHGGATAVFRVGSLSEATRLAESIAKAPGIAGAGVLLTLADTRVTVRLSRDEGRSWPTGRVIEPGFFAYSSLTVLPDRSIGLLYEANDYEKIVFARFDPAWLSDGKD